ncbi:MAG TPA: aminotransferase IV [Bacteroidales bacterium]|jgi:branched-subunit amino acid aminotransferase/4-amino-4-deoxychorismate lyase|nr:aminotransferase IV [Bacteroidales bacterium]
MSRHINFNGSHIPANEPQIMADNRGFCYGDGIFETIRCLNSQPLFFSNHYHRIADSLKLINIQLPDAYTEQYFRLQINKLLQKNRLYKAARVRLSIFRNQGGFYTPANNSASFIITATEYEDEYFSLPAQGLKTGIYSEQLKPISPLSKLKTSSSLFYVLAGIWKSANKLDDCFILNQEQKIIEGLSSNLFLVKNKVLYTTTNECGCVDGTMRKTIIEIASGNNIEVKYTNGFTEKDIEVVDEILLTNAIQGVHFVSAFRNRRYYHKMGAWFINQLNELIKEELG